jgi:HAD superfamily hydrolase (TIGR01458 family)
MAILFLLRTCMKKPYREYLTGGCVCLRECQGFLIDLDGVLYMGDHAIEGAQDAIRFLKDNEYIFRCISNTTRKSRQTVVRHLSNLGFDIPGSSIFTPTLAAIAHMKNTGRTGYYLVATGDVYKDFEEVPNTDCDTRPDWVIIGDAGDMITYGNMNAAFRCLMEGAELIALEKDRYWMAADGLSLSAGPFVQALEYATGKTAMVMGKPSKAFFNLALEDMHLPADQVAMIGDDIITDIDGAQKAGMKGILVRTGKFRNDTIRAARITPDCIIESFSHIRDILHEE